MINLARNTNKGDPTPGQSVVPHRHRFSPLIESHPVVSSLEENPRQTRPKLWLVGKVAIAAV